MDDPDVDGEAGRGIIERMNPDHLMSQLQDRACPALGGHAGVSGLALDLDGEPPHALASGLEPAIGERGLENQDVLAATGHRLDQGSRARTANLLVRGEQHDHRARERQTSLLPGLEHSVQHGQAGLHVEDAGTVQPPVLATDRHPPRVPMGQTVSRCPSSRAGRQAGRGCKPSQDMISSVLATHELDLAAQGFPAVRHA